jgi:glutathione S-transferase
LYEKFQDFEDQLAKNTGENKYIFNSKNVTIADIHLLPFMARIYFFLEANIHPTTSKDLTSLYPHITAYINAVESHPIIGSQIVPRIAWQNQIRHKFTNPDIELCYPLDLTPYEDTVRNI